MSTNNLPRPVDATGRSVVKRKQEVFLALASTGSVTKAGRSCNIATKFHYQWLRDDPDYRTSAHHALELTREHDADEIQDILLERAKDPGDRKSHLIALRYVENRRPENWRRTPDTAIAIVQPPSPLEHLSVAQLDRLKALLDANGGVIDLDAVVIDGETHRTTGRVVEDDDA